MFDRQIDLIMKDFAPVAQRYLKAMLPRLMVLKKMTFADWKLTWIAPESSSDY